MFLPVCVCVRVCVCVCVCVCVGLELKLLQGRRGEGWGSQTEGVNYVHYSRTTDSSSIEVNQLQQIKGGWRSPRPLLPQSSAAYKGQNAAIHFESDVNITSQFSQLNAPKCVCSGQHGRPQQTGVCTAASPLCKHTLRETGGRGGYQLHARLLLSSSQLNGNGNATYTVF